MGEHGLVALDWMGGNRSVLVDHTLSGAVFGLTLSTTAPEIYRALMEATAFGTRTIVEAFEGAGLPVDRVVVAGGLLQNRVADAALRRRHPAPARHPRLRAGPRPRLGHPRRRGRGLPPRHPGRRGGDGDGASATSTCPTRSGRAPTTGSTPSTSRCTTTSAAAATTSCAACAASATRCRCDDRALARGPPRRSATCTRSWSATGWWRGRAATSPPASPARTWW